MHLLLVVNTVIEAAMKHSHAEGKKDNHQRKEAVLWVVWCAHYVAQYQCCPVSADWLPRTGSSSSLDLHPLLCHLYLCNSGQWYTPLPHQGWPQPPWTHVLFSCHAGRHRPHSYADYNADCNGSLMGESERDKTWGLLLTGLHHPLPFHCGVRDLACHVLWPLCCHLHTSALQLYPY